MSKEPKELEVEDSPLLAGDLGTLDEAVADFEKAAVELQGNLEAAYRFYEEYKRGLLPASYVYIALRAYFFSRGARDAAAARVLILRGELEFLSADELSGTM